MMSGAWLIVLGFFVVVGLFWAIGRLPKNTVRPNLGDVVKIVAAVGLLFLFFLVLPEFWNSNRGIEDQAVATARLQLATQLTIQTVGMLLAVVAAVGLLVLAARGPQALALGALGMVLLGGSLIASPHWATAMAFGVIGAAYVVLQMAGSRTTQPAPPGPSAVPAPPDDRFRAAEERPQT